MGKASCLLTKNTTTNNTTEMIYSLLVQIQCCVRVIVACPNFSSRTEEGSVRQKVGQVCCGLLSLRARFRMSTNCIVKLEFGRSKSIARYCQSPMAFDWRNSNCTTRRAASPCLCLSMATQAQTPPCPTICLGSWFRKFAAKKTSCPTICRGQGFGHPARANRRPGKAGRRTGERMHGRAGGRGQPGKRPRGRRTRDRAIERASG